MADIHPSPIRFETQILSTNGFNDGTLCACLSNWILAVVNLNLGYVRLLIPQFRIVAQFLTGHH